MRRATLKKKNLSIYYHHVQKKEDIMYFEINSSGIFKHIYVRNTDNP